MEFTGVVARKAEYGGKAKKTRVFCSHNPRYNHYSIAMLEDGNKSSFHHANDGLFIELFESPKDVKILKAKDMASNVTVVLKESVDQKNALFGRAGEDCTVTFDTKNSGLKGKVECAGLTNEAGQSVAVKADFDCGSIYTWKF